MRVLARRIGAGLLGAAMVLASSSWCRARGGDGEPTLRTGGLLRVHWDYPGQATLGFGVILAHIPESFDCKTTCQFRGATIQGAAGTGAGQLAVGYGSLVGETGRGTWLIRHVYVGYGVRAVALRTWGTSTLDPEGSTFLGAEGAFTIGQFGVTLGAFRRLDPDPGDRSWRVMGGIGWGF